mgnify:CR=1 FL=1|jgi:hypothetical protein|tara:strand:- start:6995 stop:7594 length:600 start_codon:yes stop_codon:yes gene_type:complete
MGAYEYNHLQNYLKSWGKEVVQEAKDNLRAAGKSGGPLDRSIKSRVYTTGEDYVVEFKMLDYGTFVDKGVSGIGGTIKTGLQAGTYSGINKFVNYNSDLKNSPYRFGSGSGPRGGMTKGIAKFIRKNTINRDLETGKFIPAKSIAIAIMKVLWIKGIKGVSFFQDSLMLGLSDFKVNVAPEIKEDIIDTLVTFPNIERA